jgi:hypothetical protein
MGSDAHARDKSLPRLNAPTKYAMREVGSKGNFFHANTSSMISRSRSRSAVITWPGFPKEKHTAMILQDWMTTFQEQQTALAASAVMTAPK